MCKIKHKIQQGNDKFVPQKIKTLKCQTKYQKKHMY